MPRLFYFTPSYFCTSDCLMCGVAKFKRDERWGYSFSEACRQIDQMGLRPGDVLEISGGEPTAYRHLDEICRHAREHWGARVIVLSHGRHLKIRRLAERLAQAGIDRFIIPVFSHSDERHDYLTQVKGSLQETLQGLDNLRDLGVPCSIKFIPMLTNFRDAVPTFEMCFGRYPGMKFVVSGYQMMGEAYTNRELVSPRHRDVASHVERMLELAIEKCADVSVGFIPMCTLDPSFWGFYRSGYLSETVVSPDKASVDEATTRNYRGKPAACGSCAARERCQWAWYAYCNVFGTSELSPVELRNSGCN